MINLKVKTLDSRTHEFSVDNEMTVREFKDKVAERTNIPPPQQRLIYRGRVLTDEIQLRECDVEGKVLHVAERPPPDLLERRRSTSSSSSNEVQAQVREQLQLQQRGMRNSPLFRALDGMVVGTMSIPMDGGPVNPFSASSSFCMNRITVARHMLDCANNIAAYLEDPSRGLNNQPLDILTRGRWSMESTVVELGIPSLFANNQNLTEVVQGAVTAALSRNGANANVTVVQIPALYQHTGTIVTAPDGTPVELMSRHIGSVTATNPSGTITLTPRSMTTAVNTAQASGASTSATTAATATSSVSTSATTSATSSASTSATTSATTSASTSATTRATTSATTNATTSTPTATGNSYVSMEDIGAEIESALGSAGNQMDEDETPVIDVETAPLSSELSSSSNASPSGTISGTSGAGAPPNGQPPMVPLRTGTNVLADVIDQQREVQTRLEPFFEQYYNLLRNEPSFDENNTEARENAQRLYDRVSEAMHYMSHAQHAISDLMLDVSMPAPRHLTCRPILVEQSGYVRSNNLLRNNNNNNNGFNANLIHNNNNNSNNNNNNRNYYNNYGIRTIHNDHYRPSPQPSTTTTSTTNNGAAATLITTTTSSTSQHGDTSNLNTTTNTTATTTTSSSSQQRAHIFQRPFQMRPLNMENMTAHRRAQQIHRQNVRRRYSLATLAGSGSGTGGRGVGGCSGNNSALAGGGSSSINDTQRFRQRINDLTNDYNITTRRNTIAGSGTATKNSSETTANAVSSNNNNEIINVVDVEDDDRMSTGAEASDATAGVSATNTATASLNQNNEGNANNYQEVIADLHVLPALVVAMHDDEGTGESLQNDDEDNTQIVIGRMIDRMVDEITGNDNHMQVNAMDTDSTAATAGSDAAPSTNDGIGRQPLSPRPPSSMDISNNISTTDNDDNDDGDDDDDDDDDDNQRHMGASTPNIRYFNRPYDIVEIADSPASPDNNNGGGGGAGQSINNAADRIFNRLVSGSGGGVNDFVVSAARAFAAQRANNNSITNTSNPLNAFDRFLPCNSHHIQPQSVVQQQQQRDNGTQVGGSRRMRNHFTRSSAHGVTGRPNGHLQDNQQSELIQFMHSVDPRINYNGNYYANNNNNNSSSNNNNNSTSSSNNNNTSTSSNNNNTSTSSNNNNNNRNRISNARGSIVSLVNPLGATNARPLSRSRVTRTVFGGTESGSATPTGNSGAEQNDNSTSVIIQSPFERSGIWRTLQNWSSPRESDLEFTRSVLRSAFVRSESNDTTSARTTGTGSGSDTSSGTESGRNALTGIQLEAVRRNLRQQIQDFLREQVFGGQPITEGNLDEAIERATEWFNDVLIFLPQYEQTDIDARDSAIALLSSMLPNLVDICNDPDQTHSNFEYRLRRCAELFMRRLYCIFVECLGVTNSELYWAQLVRSMDRPIRDYFRDESLHFVRLYINSDVPAITVDDTNDALRYAIRRRDNATASSAAKSNNDENDKPSTSQKMDTDEDAVNEKAEEQESTSETTSAVNDSTNANDVSDDLPLPALNEDIEENPAELVQDIYIGNASWHQHFPAEWMPLLTSDQIRQRQDSIEEEEGASAQSTSAQAAAAAAASAATPNAPPFPRRVIPQEPFSDAYLAGMPLKRRKLHITKSTLNDLIADCTRKVISSMEQKNLTANTQNAETIAEELAADANVKAGLTETMRQSLRERLNASVDYVPQRFPNIARFMNKNASTTSTATPSTTVTTTTTTNSTITNANSAVSDSSSSTSISSLSSFDSVSASSIPVVNDNNDNNNANPAMEENSPAAQSETSSIPKTNKNAAEENQKVDDEKSTFKDELNFER